MANMEHHGEKSETIISAQNEMSIGQMECLQIINNLPESILERLYDGRHDRLIRNENGVIIAIEEV